MEGNGNNVKGNNFWSGCIFWITVCGFVLYSALKSGHWLWWVGFAAMFIFGILDTLAKVILSNNSNSKP
jgi:hypothetical protein